jgi:hypothetical protein
MQVSGPTPSGFDRTIRENDFKSEFTDPHAFRADSFTYAVHAVNPVWTKDLRDHVIAKGQYDPQKDVNVLNDPQRIVDKGVLSTSVIDPDHLATFGRALFVVQFPFSSVLKTSSGDGTTTDSQGQLLAHPPGATLTPQQMLAEQKPGFHNELALAARDVSIQAVAAKIMVASDGSVDAPPEVGRLQAIAQELKVPYLEIREPAALPEKPVTVSRDEKGTITWATVQHNGKGFLFRNNWNWKFFHTDAMDLEPMTQREYQELRPQLETTLSQTPDEWSFFQRVDKQMQAQFSPP